MYMKYVHMYAGMYSHARVWRLEEDVWYPDLSLNMLLNMELGWQPESPRELLSRSFTLT